MRNPAFYFRISPAGWRIRGNYIVYIFKMLQIGKFLIAQLLIIIANIAGGSHSQYKEKRFEAP
jgi:hypothetical protein